MLFDLVVQTINKRMTFFALAILLAPAAQASPLHTYSFTGGEWKPVRARAADEMVIFFTDVVVDGSRRQLKLDTGSSTTILMPDAHTALYRTIETNNVVGLSGAQACDVIRVGALGLDGAVARDSAAERCAHGDNSGGTLGLAHLSGHVLSLNTRESKIEVLGGWPTKLPKLPLARNSSNHLVMAAQAGSFPASMIFDTGASITAVDRRFIEAHPELFTRVATNPFEMRDLNQTHLATKFYRLSNLAVGSLALRDVLVVAVDLSNLGQVNILLGANAIARANWILDLSANTFAVEPHT